MTTGTLSNRDLDQDTSRGMKAAQNGWVFITDRGHPTHVLPTMQEYQHFNRLANDSDRSTRAARRSRLSILLACKGCAGRLTRTDVCWYVALLDGTTKNSSADPTLSVIYSASEVDVELWSIQHGRGLLRGV
jgi:hypothetical protein